jgi:hypothetical protein
MSPIEGGSWRQQISLKKSYEVTAQKTALLQLLQLIGLRSADFAKKRTPIFVD